MTRAICFFSVLVICLFLPGCKKDADKPKIKEYDLKGKVTAIDKLKKIVTIDHEDIPGIMPAMEMEFHAEDAKLLTGLKVGDHIQGRIKKEDDKYILIGREKK